MRDVFSIPIGGHQWLSKCFLISRAGRGETCLAFAGLWKKKEKKFSVIAYTVGVNCISPVETQAALC